MIPSCYSVVVCSPTKPHPYSIEGNEESNQDQPPYTCLLKTVFSQVHIHSDSTTALEKLKRLKNESLNPLLLLDVDSLSDATDGKNYNEDDGVTVYSPTYSSAQSTASSASALGDSRIAWIARITRQLDHTPLDNTPIIACSSSQSSSFMLDCIHAGAADYLLKPLRLDVIKTLFLKLHRNQPNSKMHDGVHQPAFLPSPRTIPETPFQTDESLNCRLKQIYAKHTLFTESVMSTHTNSSASRLPYRRLSSGQAMHLRHKISSWHFSPFGLSHSELIHCVCLILEQVLVLPQLSHVSFKEDQLYDFVSDLSNTYHDQNPYHNFAHAVDVLQCLYYFFCRLGLLSFANGRKHHVPRSVSQKPQDLLQPKDVFALLIAAIGHDAGHPGVNNLFLINSGSPLALLYNDRSVLENFHAMTLFQVIQKHGFDRIAGGPGSSEYQAFRKTIINSILATDMTLHNDYVARIDAQASRLRDADLSRLEPGDSEQERLLMCSAMIKCADISNVTRPFRHASKWAKLLIKECVSQGDMERAMGMPVPPMNDRDKVVLKDSQLGFIRHVAQGLFQSVCEVLPDLSFTIDHINENLKHWEAHDSAANDFEVSSQSDGSLEDVTVPIVIEAGCKRRHSTDCSNHTVQLLRRRLSRESNRWEGKGRRRRSAEKLAGMSALAIVNYSPVHPFSLAEEEQDHEKKAPCVQRPARQSVDEGPVYCQCTIQ